MLPVELRGLVARNIRFVARRRGVSLNRLADFAAISRPSFHRALACKAAFTTDRLAKVAAALDVSPQTLLIEELEALAGMLPRVRRVADRTELPTAAAVLNPKKR